MTIKDIERRTIRAHELYGDFWFNSEPVPISALRGQVILLEFWDYTCINSQRTLHYVKEWYRKYAEHGLVVVGVHTPKFPFGKNPEIIQNWINRFGITYPVVMDNEYVIASNYDNRSWPAIYIIDRDGFVRYVNAGEGNYVMTEHVIQTLLYEAGVSEELPLPIDPIREEDKPGAVSYPWSPELFTGYLRGSIGNVNGYSPESVIEYHDPKLYMDGRLYVDGRWMSHKHCLHLAENENRVGSIILRYHAVEVNAVINPEGERDFEVTVTQDYQFLTGENKGDDIRLAPDGRSYLVVHDPRMYNIVKNREYGDHILRLSTPSNGFAVYSFTFVSCVIPELIPDR